jgi:hypothetical protein
MVTVEEDRWMEGREVKVSDGAAAVVAGASVYMKREEGEMHLERDLPNGGERRLFELKRPRWQLGPGDNLLIFWSN